MKAIMLSFWKFMQGVVDDYMLIACLLMPVIMGAAFFLGIPALESYLCNTFQESQILSPYYLLFDLIIFIMTPMMFGFAGVMTSLEELDNGTARYLIVTPIGKFGYLASRIILPSIMGILYSVVAVMIFGLSSMTFLMKFTTSVLSTLTGIIVALFVIAMAGNKVEGMALIKLSGIIILGIPAVFFLSKPSVYLFAVFPSYWFTRMAYDKNYLFALPALLVTTIWFIPIYQKFNNKLI